ncbi:hypothetical protein MXB_3999, partial [Myxobolus squamalis]
MDNNLNVSLTDDEEFYNNPESKNAQNVPNITETFDLPKNATLRFIITKLWVVDMDEVYSPTRIGVWNEIQKFLENSYLNETLIKPRLTSISKYQDPYLNLAFTQVSVFMQYSDDVSSYLYQPLLKFVDMNESSNYSFTVMKETISVADDVTVSQNNLCHRMDIPMISACKDTTYGCCQDDIMTATGSEHQGCPEINCPCDEFLCSFVLNLSEKEFKNFDDGSQYGNSYSIYNELVDSINASYSYDVVDVYIDSRKCDAHIRSSKNIKPVYIIDMAILFKKLLPDPFEPILSIARSNKIGKIPIVKNSLIITAAYGVGNDNYQKRNKISIAPSHHSLTKEIPVFRLSFNGDQHGRTIFDSSGNDFNFYLSDSNSPNKKRTIESEYSIESSCSGTFYPKRNEIATLDLAKNSELPILFNELTFSFWLMPIGNKNAGKKSGILYAVTEKISETNNSVQKIWPVIKILNRNLTASWDDLTCSAQMTTSIPTKWSHVVIYYNILNRNIEIYENGNKIANCQDPKNISSSFKSSNLKKIILGDSTNPFEGAIDEIS